MELEEFIKDWDDGQREVKDFFVKIYDYLKKNKNNILNFKARPGISYSLRAKHIDQKKDLYVLVDVIDDEPTDRWLSICFFAESLESWQQEEGDLVPSGLMGEDACCFDFAEKNEQVEKLIISCLDSSQAFAAKSL